MVVTTKHEKRFYGFVALLRGSGIAAAACMYGCQTKK